MGAKLAAAVLLLLAQQRAAVPIEQEPQHKIVFKNDFVRVIDATLPPGYVTLNHEHAADNVSVTIANGRAGEAGARGIGRAGFSKGGYSHSVTNSGEAVMRFIVVEPLKADHPNAAAAMLQNHTLELENDHVRIYRVKLAPGQSMTTHTHAAGWVEVSVSGKSSPGSFQWRNGGEASPLVATDAGSELVEIEPK